MAVKPNLPSGKGQSDKGQMRGNAQQDKFAKPFEAVDGGLPGMSSLHNDIGEKSGFQGSTDDYIVKKGTPFGEAAKFNIMPPGMDINDQPVRDIRAMPLRTVVAESFPGDGWEPSPRDIREDAPPKGSLA